jgi:hypothetical protein
VWLYVFAIKAETYVWSGESNNTDSFVGDINIIENNAIVNAINSTDGISINTPMIIKNYGTINADLYTYGLNFHIQSAGNLNGVINGCTDRVCVTQVITSDSELKKLDINGMGFNVIVNDFAAGANFDRLRNLRAQFYEIENSVIVIDDFSNWQIWDENVSLVGSNILYINNSYTVNSGQRIKHVVNPEYISVVLLDADKLHKAKVHPVDHGAILEIVRETDYQKIFDDNRGILLGNVRLQNPNDKLLMAMDRAYNMDELQGVMNSSYRFNSKILKRPIDVINDFIMIGNYFDDFVYGLKLTPGYIMSSNISNYDVRGDIGFSVSEVDIDFGIYLNNFNYKNELNDFSGDVYGADLKIRKSLYNFWVNGIGGLSFIKYKADNIYVDNDIKNNPSGYLLYGGFSGGYDYKIQDDIIISPFVGTEFKKFNVLNFSNTDLNIVGGGNIKYTFDIDSMKYEYSAGGAINSSGDIFVNFKIDFLSTADGAGAAIKFDVLKNEYGINYKPSITGKIVF